MQSRYVSPGWTSLEALYAAVEQDRGALERWSVLCDALLQAGEVHGELMAYQLRDEAQRAVPSWFRPTVGSIADFLEVHREALLGPLADPALAVSWRRGFIDFIRIGHRPGPPPLAALLQLPWRGCSTRSR